MNKIKKRKIVLLILFSAFLILAVFLFFSNRKTYEVDYGVSFSKVYAEYLGLDWKEVYLAILQDLNSKYIRIVAPWNYIESEKGKFSFSEIDWQMNEAFKNGTKVTLVVGQKTPRWPECHTPNWVIEEGIAKEKLFVYIEEVVKRYKDHPALEVWQVENEPFINFQFGECEDYHREWVIEEINLVKSLDNVHKIIITDSGELGSWSKTIKAGDIFGTTIYRVVAGKNGKYLNYDWIFPPVFYRFKALFWGRSLDSVYVSELQAEPWFANGNSRFTSLEEQEKSMNIKRLEKNLDFVTHIGVSRAYLWGVEWWYWMKIEKNNSLYWDTVKEYISR